MQLTLITIQNNHEIFQLRITSNSHNSLENKTNHSQNTSNANLQFFYKYIQKPKHLTKKSLIQCLAYQFQQAKKTKKQTIQIHTPWILFPVTGHLGPLALFLVV